MNLKAGSVDELARMLAGASGRGERVGSFDLGALNRVLEHKAEDMTCRVQAGVTLAALQKQLAAHGQWLPLDPPGAEQLSIGALLAGNASGPRRFGYGTVRDYLIGLIVVLADGRVIHSGGNVVKNVAGYDLMKVFVGSRGSLGVMVEATFKLRPIPEAEAFVQAECDTLEAADKLIGAVFESELTPVVLDLHHLEGRVADGSEGAAVLIGLPSGPLLGPPPGPVLARSWRGEGETQSKLIERCCLVLGFAGTREEVEWQLSRAREMGIAKASSLDYGGRMQREGCSFQTFSVLPSKTVEALRELGDAPFVARAGNGIVYHGGPRAILHGDPKPSEGVRKLSERLKAELDPKHIFPESPL